MYIILNNSKFFNDICSSLYYSLKKLNIQVTKSNSINFDDNIYIIFNINNLKQLPKKFIVYNFEQLITDKIWSNLFFEKCKKALRVLDYSLENIKIFENNNIKAYHLPYGWVPTYDFQNNKKIIDILFLGSLNKKRFNILEDVGKNFNDKVLFINNKCFDEEYKNVLSLSKIGLNIHFYNKRTILELTRIIPLINSNVLVISERSDDKYYDNIFEDIIIFCEIENLVDTIKVNISKYSLEDCLKRKELLKKRLNFLNIVNKNKELFEFN